MCSCLCVHVLVFVCLSPFPSLPCPPFLLFSPVSSRHSKPLENSNVTQPATLCHVIPPNSGGAPPNGDNGPFDLCIASPAIITKTPPKAHARSVAQDHFCCFRVCSRKPLLNTKREQKNKRTHQQAKQRPIQSTHCTFFFHPSHH